MNRALKATLILLALLLITAVFVLTFQWVIASPYGPPTVLALFLVGIWLHIFEVIA